MLCFVHVFGRRFGYKCLLNKETLMENVNVMWCVCVSFFLFLSGFSLSDLSLTLS